MWAEERLSTWNYIDIAPAIPSVLCPCIQVVAEAAAR